MQPPAHRKPTPEQEEYWRISTAERDLFFANLDLVLAHERDILSCDEYFFCRPEFTHYGVLSNGHINVGTLLGSNRPEPHNQCSRCDRCIDRRLSQERSTDDPRSHWQQECCVTSLRSRHSHSIVLGGFELIS